jgi:peptidylprolyl isomerase
MEEKINQNRLETIFQSLAQQYMKEIYTLRKENNQDGLYDLQEKLLSEAQAEQDKHPFRFTPEQVKAYTTVGGTPHLDGEYTVFGEVTEGLDVVDAIQKVKTDRRDRPEEDVKIKKVIVL